MFPVAQAASSAAQCNLVPDGNRPLRTDPHQGIVVLATTSDGVPPPITLAEAKGLGPTLVALAANNSYGNYPLTMAPPIEVTIGSTGDYQGYNGQPGHSTHDLQVVLIADAIAAAQSQRQVDLTAFDVIAVYATCEYLAAGQTAIALNIGRYALVPHAFARSHAVFHEWGHAFKMPHANAYALALNGCGESPQCYAGTCATCTACAGSEDGVCDPSPAPLVFDPKSGVFLVCPPPVAALQGGCEYGDLFDYMGLQAPANDCQNVPRFKGLAPFAAEAEIHTNPIRKLQHGWIDDSEILVLGPGMTTNVELAPLSADPSLVSAPVAIEIPRRLVRQVKKNPCSGADRAEFVSESFVVYWRDNEPLVDDGASIALLSRCTVAIASKVFTFGAGAVKGLEYEAAALPPACLLQDAATGIQIGTIGVNPKNNTLAVAVSTPAMLPDVSRVPQVDVSVDELDPAVVPDQRLTGGYLSVRVAALDPLAMPCGPWSGIDRIEVEMTIDEAPLVKCLASHVFNPKTPQPWQLWIGPGKGPNGEAPFRHPVTGETLRKIPTLKATAFSTQTVGSEPLTNSASVKFILDQGE